MIVSWWLWVEKCYKQVAGGGERKGRGSGSRFDWQDQFRWIQSQFRWIHSPLRWIHSPLGWIQSQLGWIQSRHGWIQRDPDWFWWAAGGDLDDAREMVWCLWWEFITQSRHVWYTRLLWQQSIINVNRIFGLKGYSFTILRVQWWKQGGQMKTWPLLSTWGGITIRMICTCWWLLDDLHLLMTLWKW